MLRHKVRDFKMHLAVSLDDLVPADHFYRRLDAALDLSFVRELVKSRYASTMGRPSIDPVVFFKLHLIMFFEGIRSERQLMATVHLNLAHRWYIGYDLDEPVPDHSSLSKIRDRYGVEVFQQFFEAIVERCIQAGLVWGQELYFDGTKGQANAALTAMVPRWYREAQEHLTALFPPEETAKSLSVFQKLMDKYDGSRLNQRRSSTYQRTTDQKVSLVDPDATPMKRFTGDKAVLGYHTHYIVDGGRARIILAALVTPASVMDNTPMLDLVRWVRFRWQLMPQVAVGDTRYGTIPNLVGLEQDGLRAYLPLPDLTERSTYYSSDRFTYLSEKDVYLCPQGAELTLRVQRKREQDLCYRAKAQVCQLCPVKAACTPSKGGRSIFRSVFQPYIERVKAYATTPAYQKAMRKRQVWVEPLFGEVKQWHQGRRFRLRGLEKANMEGLLKATGQNIKRLLKARRGFKRTSPAGGVILQMPPFFAIFLG
ncbi:MAG: IS1182 family transposase [Chloroflexi bacterium]|nr:IS1182 family transposase [Chloroflexota bacterium]